jgi:hypothetical protein
MKTILKHLRAVTVTAIFYWIPYNTYAQKETELFIPIGQSPGVSGKLSVMGKCGTMTRRDSVISFTLEPGGMQTCTITYRSAIYLDRSKLQLTNTKGTLEDIKPGSMIEVKYTDNKSAGLVEWIKVQIE